MIEHNYSSEKLKSVTSDCLAEGQLNDILAEDIQGLLVVTLVRANNLGS